MISKIEMYRSENMKKKILIALPLFENSARLRALLESLYGSEYRNILLVDDGTAGGMNNIPNGFGDVKYIGHEKNLGYGAVFLSAYKYAKDFGYDILITVDESSDDLPGEISQILGNMDYGYDIVSCSRILENYDHEKFNPGYIEITSMISEKLYEEIQLDLTDPFSGIKGYRLSSMENMELTEFSHNLLLQIWIQAVFFSLEIIEIPSSSSTGFGEELDLYGNLPDSFIEFINTEKYLYKKGTIN
jgi:glycosyltransferase involved in cell wall biosynthesis